jgi:hypothetical protein
MRKRENGYNQEYTACIHKDGKTDTYGPVATDKTPGVTTHNQHIRLLSPEPWLVAPPKPTWACHISRGKV